MATFPCTPGPFSLWYGTFSEEFPQSKPCTTRIWACTTGWRLALYLCSPSPALGLRVVACLTEKPCGQLPADLRMTLITFDDRRPGVQSNLFAICNIFPPTLFKTEQMDAEGLGRKLLLTPSGDPRRTPKKQTVGTVTASHKMLTLQALASSLNAGTVRKGSLGRGEAFGCPPAACPPERPHPFAHYRSLV